MAVAREADKLCRRILDEGIAIDYRHRAVATGKQFDDDDDDDDVIGNPQV